MDLAWVGAHFETVGGFPRPDWNAIGPRILREVPESGLRNAFTIAACAWLTTTADSLQGAYRVDESSEFLLLSSLSTTSAKNLLAFLERARRRILTELLPGVAKVRGNGKHVAIVLSDRETYYSYIAYFYPPEGNFSATGGLFVQRGYGAQGWGYGHFVVHGRDVAVAERIVAHELTHNCLRHLPIPGWLNEGLASIVEAVLMGDNALVVRREDLDEHRANWSDGAIQEFWAGRAVHRPDERSRLTYHLARMAVKALAHDWTKFREFVVLAHWKDAGEAAAKKVYGRGLGGLVERILGPGDWTPRPQTWSVGGQSETND